MTIRTEGALVPGGYADGSGIASKLGPFWLRLGGIRGRKVQVFLYALVRGQTERLWMRVNRDVRETRTSESKKTRIA